ncbi:hypothetical protein [Desulfonatronum thiosulfatophilum]|uniref:hypothetical protein n=1 Tax=Desulfonatronum thiosulfatophilum TaxID=617002 RepID=UPI0011145D3B|nr:hypothetical protein [Desulfonatronum thiosulfatophilum]
MNRKDAKNAKFKTVAEVVQNRVTVLDKAPFSFAVLTRQMKNFLPSLATFAPRAKRAVQISSVWVTGDAWWVVVSVKP